MFKNKLKLIVATVGVSCLLIASQVPLASFSIASSSMPHCKNNAKYCVKHTSHSSSSSRAAHSSKAHKHEGHHFPQQRAATGNRVFIFDPRITQWGAYNEQGELVGTGRASGGKSYCPDIHRGCRTPSGTFRVSSKGDSSCRSKRFPVGRGGAPMPYCMFFHGGYAVHGSYSVPDYNASHGCIRVVLSAARWLSYNFMRHGTTVIVRPY